MSASFAIDALMQRCAKAGGIRGGIIRVGTDAPVPRHNEIDKHLVAKICKDLAIPLG